MRWWERRSGKPMRFRIKFRMRGLLATGNLDRELNIADNSSEGEGRLRWRAGAGKRRGQVGSASRADPTETDRFFIQRDFVPKALRLEHSPAVLRIKGHARRQEQIELCGVLDGERRGLMEIVRFGWDLRGMDVDTLNAGIRSARGPYRGARRSW